MDLPRIVGREEAKRAEEYLRAHAGFDANAFLKEATVESLLLPDDALASLRKKYPGKAVVELRSKHSTSYVLGETEYVIDLFLRWPGKARLG